MRRSPRSQTPRRRCRRRSLGGPPALETGTRELPAQAQFIDDTTELFRRFHPAFVNLAVASVQLAPAIAAGIPAVKRAPQLDNRLVATLSAVERFAADSRTVPGLVLLTQTATTLEPTLAYIEPAQTTLQLPGPVLPQPRERAV